MENGSRGRESRTLITWRKGKAWVIDISKCVGFRGLKDACRERARRAATELGWNQNWKYLGVGGGLMDSYFIL